MENIKDVADAARLNQPITNILAKIKQVKMVFTVYVRIAAIVRRNEANDICQMATIVKNVEK